MAEKEKTLYTFAVRVGASAADALLLLARDFGGNVSLTLRMMVIREATRRKLWPLTPELRAEAQALRQNEAQP